MPWSEEAPNNSLVSKPDGPERFKQIWFAGNHSDIGGSYAENESRLSDISLLWMVEEATSLPEPLIVDGSVLNLYPSSCGPQHDERESFIDALPDWQVKIALKLMSRSKLGWPEGFREPSNEAPLHTSVIKRFEQESVLIYGSTRAYRPENLREHKDVKHFFRAARRAD